MASRKAEERSCAAAKNSVKLCVNGAEFLAIGMAIALICLPLLAGSVDSAALVAASGTVKDTAGQSVNGQGGGNNYLVVLGVVISFGNLCVIAFQSWILGRQTELMEGQLKATETAANAALAALDRPWLVVEVLGHNELDWLQGRQPLIVEFQIANYGKAPAFIKSLLLLHFRSFNSNMGVVPQNFPGEFSAFPEPDRFSSFLYRRAQTPYIRGDAPAGDIKWPLEYKPNEFILGGGEKTEVLCLTGHRQLDGGETRSIDPVHLTKSYFVGSIFHEFPGNRAETLTFCYHRDDYMRHFSLFRDYAPYNGRKEAKGGQ